MEKVLPLRLLKQNCGLRTSLFYYMKLFYVVLVRRAIKLSGETINPGEVDG
jgi:hypothetical protein